MSKSRSKGPAQSLDAPSTAAAGPVADFGSNQELIEHVFADEAPVALPFLSEMERAFQQGFGSVQAYAGPTAAAANEAMGSQAFTRGERVVFADPAPSRQLVAHELAHVVQTRGGSGEGGPAAGPEADADAAAAAVLAGETPVVTARASASQVLTWSGHEHRAMGQLAAMKATGNNFELPKDKSYDFKDGRLEEIGEGIVQSPDKVLQNLDEKGRAALTVQGTSTIVPASPDEPGAFKSDTGWSKIQENRLSYGALAEYGGDIAENVGDLKAQTDEHDPNGNDFLVMASNAGTNINHFFPLSQGEYSAHHQAALKAAANHDSKTALFEEGFASHFLMDSFAAGHMAPRALDATSWQGLPWLTDDGKTVEELGLHRTKNWHDALNTVNGPGLPLLGVGRFHGDDTLNSGELDYISSQAANSLGAVMKALGMPTAITGTVTIPAGPDVGAIMGAPDDDPYKVIWRAMMQDYEEDLAKAEADKTHTLTTDGHDEKYKSSDIAKQIRAGIFGGKHAEAKPDVTHTQWNGNVLIFNLTLAGKPAPKGTPIWMRWFDQDSGNDHNADGQGVDTITAGSKKGDLDEIYRTEEYKLPSEGLGAVKAPVDDTNDVYAVFYAAMNKDFQPDSDQLDDPSSNPGHKNQGAHRQVDWKVPVGRSETQGTNQGTVDRGMKAYNFSWSGNKLDFKVTRSGGGDAADTTLYIDWFDEDSANDRSGVGDLDQTISDTDEYTGSTTVQTNSSSKATALLSKKADDGDIYGVVYRDKGKTIPIGMSDDK